MIRHWPKIIHNRLFKRTRLVAEHRIQIPQGVMDPVLFKTGMWFAQRMRQKWETGQSVLDLGCGAGLLGVFAQADGLSVTATDISPKACYAARLNGVRDVRQGYLFDPVLGQKFDHICINPPYYKHVRWFTPFKSALVGSDEFVAQLLKLYPSFLTTNGQFWIATGRGAGWLEKTLVNVGFTGETENVDGEALTLWVRGQYEPNNRYATS